LRAKKTLVGEIVFAQKPIISNANPLYIWYLTPVSKLANFSTVKNAEMHATAWWHWLRQKVSRFEPDSRTIFTTTEPSPECSGRKIDFVDRIYFEKHKIIF
jgi:hypothetical protein